MKHHMLVAVVALSTSAAAFAADWPQFRGPKRDDVSTEKGLLQTWPADGPPLVWTAKGVGGGYSSLSVAGDRIYTLGNKGKVTNVVALERNTGKSFGRPNSARRAATSAARRQSTASTSSPSARRGTSFASKPKQESASGAALRQGVRRQVRRLALSASLR